MKPLCLGLAEMNLAQILLGCTLEYLRFRTHIVMSFQPLAKILFINIKCFLVKISVRTWFFFSCRRQLQYFSYGKRVKFSPMEDDPPSIFNSSRQPRKLIFRTQPILEKFETVHPKTIIVCGTAPGDIFRAIGAGNSAWLMALPCVGSSELNMAQIVDCFNLECLSCIHLYGFTLKSRKFLVKPVLFIYLNTNLLVFSTYTSYWGELIDWPI